jgi:sialate O-acetylesterase
VSTSSSGETVTLTNIMFGDVYLCSGQSNMQFTISMGMRVQNSDWMSPPDISCL